MTPTLAEMLDGYLKDRGWSFERLAAEAELPRSTAHRWKTQSEIRRVHQWQYLARIARALDLDQSETDALLAAGGHRPIQTLQTKVTGDADRVLLAHWTGTVPNNLPAQLTSFVGRIDEIEGVTRLLATARLVTLTGTGGSGKTRLALEAAQAVLDEFEEVAFVDLAPVRDPELVIPTISQTLGLSESLDEPPLRALATHLRDRRMLLVLDNVEQVVEAAPLLAQLLGATRSVKALVTSRTPLRVRGEREFPVAPLDVPSVSAGFEELERNPAVALFADRASAVIPSFTLTPGNAPLVAAVCSRLDGLPLAIELAAVRTRHLSLKSMLGQLSRLAVASGGPRDLPDRQRTLRATIAWSYDLLGRDEQRLFDRTGVFVGGFTSEAADAVRAGIGQVAIDALVGLETLVEQNLLRRTSDGEDAHRYVMLETIREYALERIEASGEAETARRSATEYVLGLAERADLEGSGQASWLRRLEAELDNARAGLGWCREHGQWETGARLCVALMPLWYLRDHQLEARAWLEAFMVAEGEVSPDLRARMFLWHGLLLMRGTGDDASAARLFAEALVLFRDSGNLSGASETLQAQGDMYRNQGDVTIAGQRYAESRVLAEQAGNAYLVAHGWMGLALCAQDEEEFDAAVGYWRLMLEWAERAGNQASVALALNGLGEMARARGDWAEAERSYERTLKLARELSNEWRTALALHNLGYVALARDEREQAARLFRESLSLYMGRHYHKGVAECLAGLGRVEVSNGRLDRAARLCGATEAILEGLGTRLDTLDRADFERTLATLRSQGDGRLETLLDEGRAMSMDQAVEYAVADHRHTPEAARHDQSARDQHPPPNGGPEPAAPDRGDPDARGPGRDPPPRPDPRNRVPHRP